MEPNITLSFKCPKKLNELKACNDGYYCDGCHKIVYDLRGLDAGQISQRFSENPKGLCGIVNADKAFVLPKWVKWASAAMLFVGLTSCHKEFIGKVKKTDTIQTTKPIKVENDVLLFGAVVEMEPQFKGGMDSLYAYIAKHLTYSKGINGRVIVTFIIEKDGAIADVKILKTPNHSIDEKVIEVFQKMPTWTPGFQNGKPIPVQYTVPINFAGEMADD